MFDREETKRRGYSGKSKVYLDGRERLYGKDWTKRKKEVWVRGGGRCEQIVDYTLHKPVLHVRCRSEMHDPHHIITRGRQRDDRASNLIGLCRLHHELAHKKRNPRWGQASQLRSKRLLGIA